MSNKGHAAVAQRAFVVVGMAALAAMSLAACGGGSGGGDADKTLTVQVQAGAEKQFAAFIKTFKAQHPGITVKTTSVAQTAKTGSNLTVLTSSNAPDVAIVPPNSQVYSRMLQAKQLVPLNDVWQKADLERGFGSSVAATLKSNGTPYLAAYDRVFYNIIYYNKPLFAKLGIKASANHRISSLGELVSIVDKLKAKGHQGLAFGPADNYQSSWQVDSFLQGTTTAEQYKNYLSSWQANVKQTAKYTDPAFVDSVAFLQKMGKAGVYQTGYLGMKVAQAESMFVQQKAGMLLGGNWTPSALGSQGLKFDLGWMLLPSPEPSKQVKLSLYTGDALGIPVQAKHKDLAKKFLASVMSQQGQETQIAEGLLPAIGTVPQKKYAGLDPVVQEQVADAKHNGAVNGWTSVVPGGLGQQFTDPMLQSMLNGGTSPKAIGQKTQSQLQVTRSGK